MLRRPTRITLLLCAILALYTTPALAYVGPGAGLTAIGTMIAVIAALVLAVIGFVWYPLKRVMRRKRAARATEDSQKHSE